MSSVLHRFPNGLSAREQMRGEVVGRQFDRLVESFDSWPEWRKAPLRTRLRINQVEAALEGAEQGFGLVRVLRYQVADAIRGVRLREVLQDAESVPLPVNLAYAGQGALPLKLRAFLDFVRPRLRALADDGLLDRR